MGRQSELDILKLLPEGKAQDLIRLLSRVSQDSRNSIIWALSNTSSGKLAVPDSALAEAAAGETVFYQICLPDADTQRVFNDIHAWIVASRPADG